MAQLVPVSGVLDMFFVGDFLPMKYPMRFRTRKKHHLGEERARI